MRKEGIRWSFFIFGLIVLSLGIALTIKGKLLGIGPWDVFQYGLFQHWGLTIGSWSIIVGFLLLTVTSITTKKLPKIGAFLNMLLLGLFIDFFIWLLPSTNSLIGSVFFFILGVVLIGYGIGIYVSADMGSGPRDGLMILIVDKTGWSIQWVRNGIEVLVLIFGWAWVAQLGLEQYLLPFF
jgi:uncharacterized membrane protein YczE